MFERRVAITGSSGLVGTQLQPFLRSHGWQVLPIVRSDRASPGTIHWDPTRSQIDGAALDGVDAVINLAGVSIAGKRWSAARKQAIFDSRIEGTRLLAATLTNLPHPPRCLISTSAVGFYGDGGSHILTESSPNGSGFLADVCAHWERAADSASDAGIRVVHPRFGVVMAKEGGMLPKVAQPFRFGVGGRIASGRQYQSWIDIDDLTRGLLFLLENEELTGAVNLTAPEPATNQALTKALGEALQRPTIFPVPAVAIELLMGEMGKELILASQRAIPERLQEAGFEFSFPTIADSLRHQFSADPAGSTEPASPSTPQMAGAIGQDRR